MTWKIENHPKGGLQIAHLVSPRFTARWTTGEFPIEGVREGAFFWTDEGSGLDDAIHLYDFAWDYLVPDQEQLSQLMANATSEIERYIMTGA
ncbi:hypothetical protein [Palleronia pelagia]|uniref:Uncharacterized protein n=1 Tax=Palleronia pelagia TaxID=387096 RepID=A0A1H8ME28_9RHOB|nr:hypothetical protein [Palleronia pelagia]SEO15478.1 hypothetical protein SAMN04488011_1161 [Palleronia pelagia]